MNLILLGILTIVYCQNGEELKLGKTTNENSLESGNSKSYYVNIPNDVVNNTKFLIFDVYPSKDDDSDPDIYMSNVTWHYLID